MCGKLRRLANGRYEAKKAYTCGEVAALLEISVKTAKVWIDHGILPGYRLIPHPRSKAPRPAAGEWGSNPASILHARTSYGERRVRHEVLMRFLDQHRPDFDFVRAKLAHQNRPCVEQWKFRRRKKLAGATAGGSASSPAESAPRITTARRASLGSVRRSRLGDPPAAEEERESELSEESLHPSDPSFP